MRGTTGMSALGIAAARIHYNRIARIYDLLEFLDERRIRPLRRELLARAAGRVLEIGIGTGKNSCCYPSGVSITGIDVAERMLPIARRRLRRQGMSIDLVQADVLDLPFDSAAFDTAVSSFVFCSVPDPLRGLGELRRVVRPEGRILMLEHMQEGRQPAAAPGSLLRQLAGRLLGPEIRNRLTIAHVQQARLEIESIRPGRSEQREWLIAARPVKDAGASAASRCGAGLAA